MINPAAICKFGMTFMISSKGDLRLDILVHFTRAVLEGAAADLSPDLQGVTEPTCSEHIQPASRECCDG
jgi:hypothetical protein